MKLIKAKWNIISSFLYPLLFAVLLIILLQTGALVKILGVKPNILPKINVIADAFGDIPNLSSQIWCTLQSIIVGLFFGSVLGYLLAVLTAMIPIAGKGGISLITAFNAIPIVALTPIFMKMSKLIETDSESRCILAKTVVVTLVTMSSMSITSYRGLTETKPFSEDLLQSYACNKFTVLWKLRIPNSIPSIFTALKIGIPTAVITAVVSEYFLESQMGIGKQIKIQIGTLFSYSVGWAYIIVACIMGIGLYAILMLVQYITLKHRK